MVSHNEKSQYQIVTKAGSYQILRPSGLFNCFYGGFLASKYRIKK